MSKRPYRRRTKLIKPRLQLKIALACCGIAVMSSIVLVLLINTVVTDFADGGGGDPAAIQGRWLSVLAGKLGLALAILVPMTLAIGVLLMHRIAGPLYRFEVFLRPVVQGEHPEPCRIRNGDELVDMCRLLNEFTQPLRDGTVDLAPFAAAMNRSADAESDAGVEVDVETEPEADLVESAAA